jgi:hypothetical protein
MKDLLVTTDDGRELGLVIFNEISTVDKFDAVAEVILKGSNESVSGCAPAEKVNEAIKFPESITVKTPERSYILKPNRWFPKVEVRSFIKIEFAGYLKPANPATPDEIVKTILYGHIYKAPWSILGEDAPAAYRPLDDEQQLRLSIAATVLKMLRPA